MRNWVPWMMRAMFRTFWSSPVARLTQLLIRHDPIRRPPLSWRTIGGPFFGNAISTLVLDGRTARIVMESSRSATPTQPLETVLAQDLSS
jgi:hypothetical protein